MDNVIEKTLTLLGFSRLETKIFLATFKLGSARIPEVARLAKIKRSTAYLIIKDLIEKGYLLEDHTKYANNVYTITPENLLTKLSAKERIFKRQELEFQDNLPAIKSIYQANEIRPKVTTYSGNNGLIAIWRDILSTKNEILLWTNQQTENDFFGNENHDKFIKERLSKNIHIRVLATNSPEAKVLQKLDKESLRTTKILPSETKFSTETYVYDNKVAMLDYNKDVIGIIIESAPISSTQKAIFETMWKLM